MKITHNSNNYWQDEAKVMGLDPDLYPWVQAIIRDTTIAARKKIYTDLMAIADAGEYEDLRRELELYFNQK